MQHIDSGEPFTMEFVTADRRRGTGGELILVDNWVKMHGQAVEEARPGSMRRRKMEELLKNPDHTNNKTFNIYNSGNRLLNPIKVHYRLIQTFNGKRVTNG